MDFLRATLRGLLVVLTSVSLATLISLCTLQATILNRNVVIGWLANSGIYKNIVDSVVQLKSSDVAEAQQFLDETTTREAINKTLDPVFLQSSTEKIINSTYDWLQGKSDKIEFSIALSDKREQLKTNLTEQIKPKLDSLPKCTSSFSGLSTQQIQCIPSNTNAEAYANSLATRSVNSSDFLSKPFTQNDIQINLPQAAILRFIATNIMLIISGLAAVAVLSATGYILLSKERLRGLQAVGRRVFFGTILLVVAGASLWFLANKVSLESFGDQLIIVKIVDPLARLAANDIGMWLFIFSGIVFIIGGIIWLGAFLLIKNINKKTALIATEPKDLPPAVPPAV